jgi:flagellar basal-body rod protein FlgG
MIDALSIAASGLTANQAWIDSISNNVANMQTVGYKRSQVDFHDMVRQSQATDAGGRPTDQMLMGGRHPRWRHVAGFQPRHNS